MVEPGFDSELSSLLDVARRAQPPALPPLVERRMVRNALTAAERPRSQRMRYLAWLAAAVLLLTVAGGTLLSLNQATRVQVAATGLPLRLALKTGDALTLAPGSELLVLQESPRLRKLELNRGSVLFEVARLQRGQGFYVQTAHGQVHVLGTIFSVETDSRRTQVRVYEGKVAVAESTLLAGQSWASDGKVSVREALASEAEAAVRARLSASPRHVVMPLPSVDWPERTPNAPARVRSLALEARPQVREQTAEDTLAAAHQLRALGHFAEAAAAYETIAANSSGASAIEAGYAAAQLAQHTLLQSQRALVDVERFQLTAPDSPLRERARALRIEALWTLGRHEQARDFVREYLHEEQATETSRRLRSLLP